MGSEHCETQSMRAFTAAAVIVATVVATVPVAAHAEAQDPWLRNLIADADPPTTQEVTHDVERWRGLVQAHFGPTTTDAALRVMACESGGNPDAYNSSSGASGLFQHLQRYWDARSDAAGWGDVSPFDPPANVAVAAWLSNRGADWSHWVCKP